MLGNVFGRGLKGFNGNEFGPIWGYQDFTAGVISTTTVILTENQNGVGMPFNVINILDGLAFITQATELESYVYTGSTKLFSSKVKVLTSIGDTITLSGIPHVSWGDVRIWYRIQSNFFPTGYTNPPKMISASSLDKLDPIILTQDEIVDNLLSTDAMKALSANQGKVLKDLYDSESHLPITVRFISSVADFENPPVGGIIDLTDGYMYVPVGFPALPYPLRVPPGASVSISTLKNINWSFVIAHGGTAIMAPNYRNFTVDACAFIVTVAGTKIYDLYSQITNSICVMFNNPIIPSGPITYDLGTIDTTGTGSGALVGIILSNWLSFNDGIHFIGDNTSVNIITTTNQFGGAPGSAMINFDSGVFTGILITGARITPNGGSAAFHFDPGATYFDVVVSSCVYSGFLGGSVYTATSLKQDNPIFNMTGNSRMANSIVIGSLIWSRNDTETLVTQGDEGPITAFADAGGGQVTVSSAGHGIANGETVDINATTNYNGRFTASNVTGGTFEITATFNGDDATGFWETGWTKVLGTTIQTESERSSMTADNEITFTNLESKLGNLRTAVSVQTASGGTTPTIQFTFFLNGEQLLKSGLSVVASVDTNAATPVQMALDTPTSIITGDTISLYGRNISNNNGFILKSGTMILD